MTIVGKAMANGFPISALVGKRKYMSILYPQGRAFFSGTFNGNPVSTAASLKTIEILERPGFYERLYKLGDDLRSRINATIDQLGVKVICFGYGSVWYLYFNSRPPENYRDLYTYRQGGGSKKERAYRDHMLNHGIFVYPARGTRAYLSGAHTASDIDVTADAVTKFLNKHRRELS